MSGKKTDISANKDEAVVKKRGRPPKKVDALISAEEKPKRSRAKKAEVAEAAPVEEKPKRTRAKKAEVAEVAPAEEKPKRSRAKKTEVAEAAPAEEKPKRSRAKKAEVAEAAPAEEKPKRSRAKKAEVAEDKPSESSKTPQVMRLVRQDNDIVNPTILAGKSSIPRRLRGLEPLSRIMKREAEEIFDTDEEAVTYNVTALVIEDHAAEILKRFNACDCEVCVEELSRLTAEIVPARFAKLRPRAVERNTAEVAELKEPLNRKVTSEMIRLVIRNKKRSYHDGT
ncbi:MAG: hypothetical protein IJO91_03975 [Oscillospiraceae bacterium]|nr:hypothetical protein [Oscillospiraceae bacterium]